MVLSRCKVRRVVGGVIAAGPIGAAMLFGFAPSAFGEPPTPAPPGCSAADLARVSSGVASATSDYLYSHPDVNNFLHQSSRPAERRNPQRRPHLHGRQPPGPHGPYRDPAASYRPAQWLPIITSSVVACICSAASVA